MPVVQDNPLNGPAWPNDTPTIGNVSVAYSAELGLWLMTYDGGRQTQKTTGFYFTYAAKPWGPWTAPQLIFNDVRDSGLGSSSTTRASCRTPRATASTDPSSGATTHVRCAVARLRPI